MTANATTPQASIYRCIHCGATYPLSEPLYACSKCGNLLEVNHQGLDLSAKSPAEWKSHFEKRLVDRRRFSGSGVWRFHDWVMPDLPESSVVSLGEGSSALTSIPRLNEAQNLKLWIKQCGHTHTGSFKDLGMTVLVSWVNHLREQERDIQAMLCASTGDTSAALAAYGAAAGIPVVVLLPRGKISQGQLLQPLAHGARVLSIDTDFDGCMRHVQALAEDPRFYLANSKNSLRIEGQKTVAFEIVQDLGWETPDWVAIPGGNLGNVSALVRGFEQLQQAGIIQNIPRILCAQAEVASPLFAAYQRGFDRLEPQQAGETYASAIRIGAPVSYPKAVAALRQTQGVVDAVSEAEIAQAARNADACGLYACPHTAVALAAVERQRQNGTIQKNAKVVVVSTAHGLKFNEFKQRQRIEHLEPEAQAHQPIEVEDDLEMVRNAAIQGSCSGRPNRSGLNRG